MDITKENKDKINESYPEGSFRHLFWEEKFKMASVTDSRQMRWHPMLIRWCLNLKLLSSSAYYAIRSSGFVTLPSSRINLSFIMS